MAKPDHLEPAVLRSVANQLSHFLAAPRGLMPLALGAIRKPELAESLAVCFVTAAQVTNPPADITVLARPSGLWHHQVWTEAGPTHMARSNQQGFSGVELEVSQLMESPIVAKVDAVVDWIDEFLTDDDATIRLLLIPAYYVHALLIVRGDKLSAVLVDQPTTFTQLKYEKEYTLKQFLKRLAKERISETLT
jgi:hypothetical protein